MTYSTTLLEYFHDRRYLGQLDCSKSNVHHHAHNHMDSRLAVYLEIVDGQIKQVRYQVMGPPALIASCAWIAEHLEQQPTTTLHQLSAAQIGEVLELPKAKHHPIALALRTFQQALDL